MKLRDKNKFYTFMVVPHDAAGHAVSFRIPAFVVRYSLLILAISTAVFGASILYSTILSGRLIHYGMAVQKEAESSRQLDTILGERNTIEQELQSVLDQNNELRKVLGLKINKTKIQFDDKTNVDKEKPYGLNFKFDKIAGVLDLSLKETKVNKLSLEELKARVKEIQSRLASTPSTWPLYGRIASYFGYRRYPWRSFHTGIDIDSSYGAPVRATAPGVVCYAGWMQGYGKAVEIDHGYGFKTLYGHNSKFNVSVGEKIAKGQVVSYVGMTGDTTGPHVHYEVRKHDSPINPMAFLNLNILSAGRYF